MATRKLPSPQAGSKKVDAGWTAHISSGNRSSIAWTVALGVKTSPRSRTRSSDFTSRSAALSIKRATYSFHLSPKQSVPDQATEPKASISDLSRIFWDFKKELWPTDCLLY